MKKFFISFGFLSALFLSGCQFGSQSSAPASSLSANVRIGVNPVGGKSFGVRRPVIYLSGGSQVCRPRPYTHREARDFLLGKQAGGAASLSYKALDEDFLDEFFPIYEERGGGEAAEGSGRNDPVLVDVSNNWFKFGLTIENANTGTNTYLVIDSLSYNASARHKAETFSSSGNVNAGYCSGGGSSAPFLYFIPPNSKVEYRRLSKNPFHNLTIFVDGFDIIDRSEDPSPRLQRLAGTAVEGSSDPLIVIPVYDVELTLRGYFMTKDGDQFAGFVKRARFTTASSI